MASLPFHSSASDDINPAGFDVEFALTPLNNGTRDARENKIVVTMNHLYPPLCIWEKMSCPLVNSIAMAVVKPSMARRPLIRSAAGPLKAMMSVALVLSCIKFDFECEYNYKLMYKYKNKWNHKTILIWNYLRLRRRRRSCKHLWRNWNGCFFFLMRKITTILLNIPTIFYSIK